MILHDLSEEEMYFYALFMDESGIDQAEFCLIDDTTKVDVIDEETGEPVLDHDGNVKQVDGDGVFRCWPVQQFWWRTRGNKILSQGSRSVGKSLSIKLKTFAFPFVAPGAEMVLTAPEGAHLDALTNNVETLFIKNKIAESMLAKDQRGRIKHRPFQVNFQNGGYILARLPKFDGSGIRGTHPLYLEQDEGCLASDTLILTKRGYVPIKDVNIGDMVLTHKNRWRSVTNVINNGLKKTVTVKGQGHYGLRVTENHKFFAQEVLDYNDRKNKWGVKEKSEFKWLRADQMDGNLWSTPASIPDIEIPNNVEKSKTTSLSYSIEIQSNAFLWCLGLYVAEGSTSSSYGTGGKLNKSTWSIHVDEVDEVTNWMDKAGIKYFVQPVQSTSNCMNVVVAHINLAPWLSEQCGSGCYNKKIPLWIFSLPDDKRQSFYDGLVFGDGCNVKDDRYAEGQHALSTTSKSLAFLFRTLAHSLGRKTAITYTDAGIVSQIRDRYFTSGESFDVRSRVNGQGFYEDNLILHKVKSVTENSDEEEVWDITVEEDESFIAEGIVVHNSFYPEPGWKEIIETVKAGDSRARWRCHGVTVGPGNTFDDKISGKDSTWKVLRLPAMYRPTWTDKERHDKEIEYGGADSPDYRRNVLGLSANSGTPLLVMHRLMEAADTDEMSAYNLEEYYKCVINDAQIREVDSILDLFDPPISHTKYGKVWIGMDYGLTTSNSCIVIFAEVKEKVMIMVGLSLSQRLLLQESQQRIKLP